LKVSSMNFYFFVFLLNSFFILNQPHSYDPLIPK